jgi:environmental stress-induced protein Ves
VLGRFLFCGNDNLVRDVLAGGHWVVRGGRHKAQDAIARRYTPGRARTARTMPTTKGCKPMTMLIPYAGLSPVPWKNGGGSTTQIAVFPPDAGFDDFDWRVSLATIADDGAFSEFPGVERTLALVDGHGMTLEIDGEPMLLSKADPVARSTANRAWWPS